MEQKSFDYLNVIPLVDVMLVLLTIVLTTSTFIATGGIPVELPQASKSKDEPLKNRIIELDRKGHIYLNGKAVTLPNLKATFAALDRATPILIRADKALQLQSFVDVLDAVKTLGFKKVSLQTEAKP